MTPPFLSHSSCSRSMMKVGAGVECSLPSVMRDSVVARRQPMDSRFHDSPFLLRLLPHRFGLLGRVALNLPNFLTSSSQLSTLGLLSRRRRRTLPLSLPRCVKHPWPIPVLPLPPPLRLGRRSTDSWTHLNVFLMCAVIWKIFHLSLRSLPGLDLTLRWPTMSGGLFSRPDLSLSPSFSLSPTSYNLYPTLMYSTPHPTLMY